MSTKDAFQGGYMRGRIGAAFLWAGWVWLAITAAVIVFSYLQIATNQGLAEVMELLSPFNILNYLTMAAAFVPGMFLMWLGSKIADKPILKTDGTPNL